MALRRRKPVEPDLKKLLEGYHASAHPSSPNEGVATIRCWKCHKPNVYDSRRDPPGRCAWCRSVF